MWKHQPWHSTPPHSRSEGLNQELQQTPQASVQPPAAWRRTWLPSCQMQMLRRRLLRLKSRRRTPCVSMRLLPLRALPAPTVRNRARWLRRSRKQWRQLLPWKLLLQLLRKPWTQTHSRQLSSRGRPRTPLACRTPQARPNSLNLPQQRVRQLPLSRLGPTAPSLARHRRSRAPLCCLLPRTCRKPSACTTARPPRLPVLMPCLQLRRTSCLLHSCLPQLLSSWLVLLVLLSP
jgi:hypothetical protein